MSERYLRQIPLIGASGQEKLASATVFIAGAGGLGSPVSMYLADVGIGCIRIADGDRVEESNLNRQLLHIAERIGMPKSESAQQTLTSLNPSCRVVSFAENVTDSSVTRLIGDASLIIDCLDNFEARYVLNRASQTLGLPLLHAAVSGYSGQLTLIVPGKTPCLSCIFPEVKSSEEKISSLGVCAGVVGSLQALEAVRVILGLSTLNGKLLLYDATKNSLETFSVKKSSRCPVCSGAENK
ncbi:MAG TPA: HesA/MoeB/ThiF family protein [Methanocorpusculum sp.]|nr:HesA/MoeB/ThiF family protein [Methanocorpusculum sp.]